MLKFCVYSCFNLHIVEESGEIVENPILELWHGNLNHNFFHLHNLSYWNRLVLEWAVVHVVMEIF